MSNKELAERTIPVVNFPIEDEPVGIHPGRLDIYKG